MKKLKEMIKMPAKKGSEMEQEAELDLEGLDLEDDMPEEDMLAEEDITSEEMPANEMLADVSDEDLLMEIKKRGITPVEDESSEADMSEDMAESEDELEA